MKEGITHMINAKCPKCGNPLQYEKPLNDTVMRCPNCNTSLKIKGSNNSVKNSLPLNMPTHSVSDGRGRVWLVIGVIAAIFIAAIILSNSNKSAFDNTDQSDFGDEVQSEEQQTTYEVSAAHPIHQTYYIVS